MFISGIQQIGIGVCDAQLAFKWHIEHFGMDLPMFDDSATAGLMLPYTGGQPRQRRAILALNLQGGGGMEIWQYTCRTPAAPAFTPALGDLGIFVAKVKSKNAEASYAALRARGVDLCTDLRACPDGRQHFYARDPWGNLFEVVGSKEWFNPKLKAHTGGIYGCMIGVSDMSRALEFYQHVLGYETVVYDRTGQFDDFAGIPGGDQTVRRVLLRHATPRRGPFCRIFGDSEIELVQTLDRSPRKIFQDRFWGDIGFIHLCFDVCNMAALRDFCAAKGHPFTVDSSGSFDMGEAAGSFSYIEDPDGALIEFVETHRIPILKKMGLFLNLKNRRKPEKPLPDLLLKALGLARVRA